MSRVAMQEEQEQRAMPVNVEAEAALVGGLLINANQIEAIHDILKPEDFSDPLLSRIYRACLSANANGSAVNPITIKPFMEGDEALKKVGNDAFLAKLTVVSSAVMIGMKDFARQIVELAKRRRLIEALVELQQRATMTVGDDNISSIMEDADTALTKILDRDMDDASGIKQVSAHQAFREMIEAYDEPNNGVTCGSIGCLDDILGPIRPHHLVIAAGRPGMGKTALALSYAIGAAKRGHGVLFVSLEMSRMELMQRATADVCFDGRSGVPYELIRDGSMEDRDRRRVYEAGREFQNMPFNIIDAGALTISRLNMLVRRWKRRMEARGQSLDLVIIDYLQLLQSDSKSRSNYETVSEVSRGLKSIAKTYDVGVMALAQLSRKVEERPDKKPMLSDLRDSGQIEQDADAVLFLYRAEYYLRDAMVPEKDPKYHDMQAALAEVERQIEFIIAKRRNGRTGRATGAFHGAFQAVRGDV